MPPLFLVLLLPFWFTSTSTDAAHVQEVKILATAREILREASQDPDANIEPGDERRNTRTRTRSEKVAAATTQGRIKTLNAGIKDVSHTAVML